MTLFTRIILGVIALVAVIAVVGVLALGQLDLNHQKQRIEQLVLEQTGRELRINGRMTASLFPRPGLLLNDVSMGNADDFVNAEFASVTSADLKVAVLPLLTGKVKVQSVALQGLSLILRRNADGKTNWDDLMAATAVVETESDDNVMREVEAGTPIIAALSVGAVQINDANISYSDARDESYVALRDLNLSTGAVLLSEPFAFESDFKLISSVASRIDSQISASGEIAVDLVNNIYTLQQLNLKTINSGGAIPTDSLPFSLQGELVADLNAQSINVTVADGMLSGVPVRGEFEATSAEDNPRFTGVLSGKDFDAAQVLDQLGIANRFPDDSLQNASVTARFEYSQDNLLIQGLEASISDVTLNADLQIANPAGSGVLSGQLRTNRFNPAPWVRGFGFPVPENGLMQSLQLVSDVRQSGQLLSFNQINVQLDGSTITGSVELSDINADNSPVTYALMVDQINLDQYLPTPASDNTQTTQVVSEEVQHLIPVDGLRQLNLAGELTLGEVTLSGITAQNAVIPVLANDGKIEITEAKADLHSGSFFTNASLDLQSEEPLLTLIANLNSLNADAFLQDMLAREAPLTGIANVSVDMLSRGTTWSQLFEHANGALSMRVTDGQLRGIDIASELRDAGLQIINDEFNPASDQLTPDLSSATEFSEYSLSAVLTDGVLKSDDLVFTSPYLTLTGEGGVSISSRTVDYLLHLTVADELEEGVDELLRPLAGVELSLPLRGLFTNLGIDLPQLLLNAFQSGLISEIESRYSGSTDAQLEIVKDRIAAEKEALRLRLDKKQQAATQSVREKKEQVEVSTEEARRQLEIKLEQEKNALKNKLQDNLKKNLDELLGEKN